MPSAIVIGSGFGGSITAHRLIRAGWQVTLLEMGEDWRDPAKLQQSQDARYVLRLFRSYPHDYARQFAAGTAKVAVMQGMGLGGGSLVYSGIHIRAPVQAFAGWPAGWTRAHLDPYYARVEDMLRVAPLADAAAFGRTRALARGAAAAGLPAPIANPLAMQGCTRCGWCIPICVWGKKQTMVHTYLADPVVATAIAEGRLVIRTNARARLIARHGGKYRVVYWRTDGVRRDYHRVNSSAQHFLDADKVFVSCGAIESPALLQRSLRETLPAGYTRLAELGAAADTLGTGVDGVGDFVQGGFVPDRIDGYKGSVMMMHIDMGDYVLEDIHAVPVGPTVSLESTFPGMPHPWGLDYRKKMADYGAHMLAVAIIGKQGKGTAGNIRVHDDGGLATISKEAYQPPDGSMEVTRSIITKLGGQIARTPWERWGAAATVHPVGGCRMGDDPDAPVLAADLSLRNNPGVHVIDGSVLPGSPQRNPSHTIAAIAERALDVIVGGVAASDWPTRT
jgi:cholesterol oxidase